MLLPTLVRAESTTESKLTPIILELRDANFTQKIWSHLFPESPLPLGEFQILLPFRTDGQEIIPVDEEIIGQVYLLRNGTEIARMERAEWQSLVLSTIEESQPHKSTTDLWISTTEGTKPQAIPLVWKSAHVNLTEVISWMEWPAGFRIKVGSSVTNIPASAAQFQRNIELGWDQKLWNHFLLGASLHRSQYGGGLTQMALDAAPKNTPPSSKSTIVIQTPSKDFWGESYWWWRMSMGVAGIKYTLSLANLPLPQYYWIDPSAATEIRERRTGPILNQWTGATLEKSGNFSHTIDTKMGYFRYALHYDLDAYRFPINTFGMDDLPIAFGTWGAGFIVASEIVATRVWFNIPNLTGIFPMPKKYPSNLNISFLRFEFDYRTLRNFNLALSVQFHINNLLFNLPGAEL